MKAVRVRDSEGRTKLPLQSGGMSITDDRGVYRIYGLLPGAYLVCAGGSGSGFGYQNPFAFDARIYYPSSTRDAATEITVQAGVETTGTDLRWRSERGFVVSGTIRTAADSESSIRGFIQFDLINPVTGAREASGFNPSGTAGNGFAFYGVSDGEYDLIASSGGSELIARSQPRRIVVSGRDVTGLELTLLPVGSLAGKVVIETLQAENKAKTCHSPRPLLPEEILISVSRDQQGREEPQDYFPYARFGSPNSQGEFTVKNLEAGRWRLIPRLPDDNFYLRSITLPASAPKPARAGTASAGSSANDPARNGLTLKSGERVTGLIVTAAEGAAALKGKVSAEGAKLPARLRVFLLPAEKEVADNVLRYAEAGADGDGAFSFSHLAPGRYLLLARAVPENESADRPVRPLAWDSNERAKLRREAEAANVTIELKPCQRVNDYTLRASAFTGLR
ncbi:MAG TPA: hypothetical protein VNQ79_02600 [Blastocatellia bacterium]|nr:hypothetical protein [Blastocatellia bacterium]